MKFFRDLKPVLRRDEWTLVLVIMMWTTLTALPLCAMFVALMAFVSGANAAPIGPKDLLPVRAHEASSGPYAAALEQAHACYPDRPKLAPPAFDAVFSGVAEEYCAFYLPEPDMIVVNIDRTDCPAVRLSLLHELIHAYGFDHPDDEDLIGTPKDPHYREMERCRRIDPAVTAAPFPQTTVAFEATTSADNMKRLAFGPTITIAGPFDFGVRMGLFNTVNIRIWDAYAPFGQVELGYKVEAGPLYVRIAQGAALVGGGFLATPYQFPTSLEIGLRNAQGWKLGLLGIHYSNGGAGQRGRVYNGVGISIGRAL